MLQQIGVTRADISFLHAATDRNSNLRLQAATGSVINITLTRGALNGGLSSRLPLHLVPVDHQPSKLVKMMPQHLMPAAGPEPERLDETQVKMSVPKKLSTTPRADERRAEQAGRPRADGVCAAGAPPGPSP